jgi:hypothetical protein
MNTFDENLRTTVETTLTSIDGEEQKRASELTVAHYDLYYAVGDQIRAEKKLDDINISYDKTFDISHQGTLCNNRATNLLTTATNADANVTTTVTNTATAASNVQIASNAVLKVAAGIGSANNIVNASDFDTDIQRMTSYANEVTGKTAYQAELTSQMSMQASADTAQIIAKQVLEEATTTKAWFDNMVVRTDAELTNLTDTRIVDTDALIGANTEQRGREGGLYVAKREHSAVTLSYNTANNTLNNDLQVNTYLTDEGSTSVAPKFNLNVTSLFAINLYFEKLVAPFPFRLPTVPDADDTGNNALLTAMGSRELDNEYYIGVSKADTAGLFSFDVAETTFNSFGSSRFFKVDPGEWQPVAFRDKPASTDAITGAPIAAIPANLKLDVDGNDIVAGIEYVSFIYIVIDNLYKKATNNFSDQISAASLSFTLAETLLEVTQQLSADTAKTTFQFQIVEATDNPTVQYRGIMVPMHSLCNADTNNCDALTSMRLWFDLSIAEQVAEVNYKVAENVTVTDLKEVPNKNVFEFSVNSLTTDNFGQPLEAKKAYIPMVLSIVLPTTVNQQGDSITANYLAHLSWMNEFTMGEAVTLLAGTPPDGEPVKKNESVPDGDPVKKNVSVPDGTPIEGTVSVPDGDPVKKNISVPDGTPLEGTVSVPDNTAVKKNVSVPDDATAPATPASTAADKSAASGTTATTASSTTTDQSSKGPGKGGKNKGRNK